MTTFTFDGSPVFSVPEGSCPGEIISHLLTTRHATNDDPFFAIDLGLLPQLVDLWRQLFPSIRPFYAVKCNPDPLMLSLLARMGVGFDCASKGEIRTLCDLLSSLDLSPSDSIIYANPCKQLSHIQYSKLRGQCSVLVVVVVVYVFAQVSTWLLSTTAVSYTSTLATTQPVTSLSALQWTTPLLSANFQTSTVVSSPPSLPSSSWPISCL